MFTCVFTSMDAHTIRVYAYIYVHIYVCTHIFTHTYMFVRTYLRVWIFMKPLHNLVHISRHVHIMTNITWLVFNLDLISSCMMPVQWAYCVLWKKGIIAILLWESTAMGINSFYGNQQLLWELTAMGINSL